MSDSNGRRHRSFRSADGNSKADEAGPVTFDLDGEKFTCAANPPGGAFMDMIDNISLGADDESLEGIATAKVLGFVNEVLLPPDRRRFQKMIRSTEHVIPIETIGEITMWLIEEYTGRPFGQPSVSSGTS